MFENSPDRVWFLTCVKCACVLVCVHSCEWNLKQFNSVIPRVCWEYVFNNKTSASLSVQCVCVCVCVLSLHFLKLTDTCGGLSPEVMLTCQTSKRKINKHTEVGKHCYYSEVIQRWCMCVKVNLKSVNVTVVIHLQGWTKVLWVYIH